MDTPKDIANNVGNQDIAKGNIAGQLHFYAWDAITHCRGAMCPAFDECDADVKSEVQALVEMRTRGYVVEIPKCEIMKQYLESVTSMLFRNYAEDWNEAQLYRIGMGLIPQYRQLCRLQIEELGLVGMTYVTEKGDPRLHPLVTAIRDQIVAIEKMWHSIGLPAMDDADLKRSNNAYDTMNREAIANMGKNKKD